MSYLYDAHCHPTDQMVNIGEMPTSGVRQLAAMATRIEDQDLVAELATLYPDQVIPCFGIHPWFA